MTRADFALLFSVIAASGLTPGADAAAQGVPERPEIRLDRVQTTLLEIRLAETQPAPGLIEATVQNSDRRIFLHDTSIITNNDVVRAHVLENGGRFEVAITLAAEGAARMAAATTQHSGKPLAIIVNGDVVAALTVRATIRNEAVITGGFTREQATAIANGLQR